MGLEYLLVHLKYTIPPALLLTLLFRPLQTRLDTYRIAFLLTISVLSTIPWDSNLIANNVWGYPTRAVLGPTLFGIPIEEVFFFFIQTYTTTVFYLLCNKTSVHVAYLNEIHESASGARVKRQRIIGATVVGVLVCIIAKAVEMVKSGGKGMYMGLLGIWAGPFTLGLWCIAYQHIISLPLKNTLVPIAVPSVYLCAVDTLAMKRGTWVILPGTKLGIQPWRHMEIEELTFFVCTNVLIVFGLVAFDYAVALMTAFPSLFPDIDSRPSLGDLMTSGFRALCTRNFPVDEYRSIPESIDILKRKSRSFYLASGVFEGRLRLDLITLYSFCRAADDLIDESPAPELSVKRLQQLLDIAYDPSHKTELDNFVKTMFPPWSHTALLSLPSHKIPKAPFNELLEGFRTDIEFSASSKTSNSRWPIKTDSDLQTYSHRVAGTVGEMFLHLVFAHCGSSSSFNNSHNILKHGQNMGIALQYVNIARDIAKDAAMGRVYIPSMWLTEEGLTEEAILATPNVGERFRARLLKMAEEMYSQSRQAIELLPDEARLGGRVAVESYMDIGRRLAEGLSVRERRWRGSKVVRIWRAWKVMGE
ncbi:Lycopene beta-cyclase [Wilcoxina mikolae CBS 423.85]|nr:Lycopene beta-cyclase [Wilcoxina mikolae CBS 423.85]